MLTELFLAGRFLRPRRSAVSLITITSILGVILGVMVLMVVLAVMTGFTEKMKRKLVETQAHFQIDHYSYLLDSPEKIVKAVESAGGRAIPVMQGPVLVQYQRNALDPQAAVFGAAAEDLQKQFDCKKILKAGTLSFEGKKIVISQDMADRWGVGIGSKLLLHSARKLTSLVRFNDKGKVELNPDSSAYLPAEFTVGGIYEVGKYDFDRMVIFADIDDAASLFNFRWGTASCVLGWGPDPFNQSKLLKQLREKLFGLRVVSWEEKNQQLLGVLAVEKRMMFFLLIFIVLVAAFSIANTLITTVYQKTREIGMMKALGMSDGSVTLVFVLQGFLIGTIGSLGGVGAGALVIHFRNDILHIASKWSQTDLFPRQFYFFSDLPAQILAGDVLFIVISSIVLCTFGALLPALRAARLDPAESLRF